MPDIASTLTIEGFGRALRERELTALDVTEACLKRIDELQPRLNAFIRVMAENARRDAAVADRELAEGLDRGPLHGVPIAVKDLIDMQACRRPRHRACARDTWRPRMRRSSRT